MATVQQEFNAGAILLELYKDLPYVRKLGYSIGEIGDRILVRVIIDAGGGADVFYDDSMASVREVREFRDRLPASVRDKYEVVPVVSSPHEGALRHFGTMTAVIDR